MSAKDTQIKKPQEILQAMPEYHVNEFHKLLKVQSHSDNETPMVAFIASWLTKNNLSYEVDIEGNILVTKGGNANTYYPCVVAHMDTVHEITDNYKVLLNQKGGRVIATSPTGVGGDDKVGIYIAMQMLLEFDNIKVAFFTQEEAGLVGSSNVDLLWFEDVGYIIQADRWGRSDLVNNVFGEDTTSNKLRSAIDYAMRAFRFKDADGLITDSINLWENHVGVSCVNVSCGYYEHHTPKEKVDLNEMYNSLLFIRQMIIELGEGAYPSLPDKPVRANTWSVNEHYDNIYDWQDEYDNKDADIYDRQDEINEIINTVYFHSWAETIKDFQKMIYDPDISESLYELAIDEGYGGTETDFAFDVMEYEKRSNFETNERLNK